MKTALLLASLQLAFGFRNIRSELNMSSEPNMSSGCVNLLVIGDFGEKGSRQRAVVDGMARVAARINPAAILAVGDNIYPNGAENQSKMVSHWRDIWQSRSALRRPWYAVTGNHDWRSNARHMRDFTKSSSSRGNWIMPKYWHRKRWGDVEAFFVDTQIWRGRVSSYSSRIGEQRDYLRSRLRSSSASWKIVVGHHPTWSVGNHGGSSTMKKELDPIARREGSTIYLAGHDHSMQHIFYRNVNYVISGAGSKSARERSDDLPSRNALLKYQPKNGFASLQFCPGSRATLKFYSSSGSETYSARLRNDKPSAASEQVGTSLDEATCNGVEMSRVDQRCSLDGCTVLADIDSTSTSCDQYCHDQGLKCSGAWFNDEDHEECAFDGPSSSCSALGDGEMSQVCRCA